MANDHDARGGYDCTNHQYIGPKGRGHCAICHEPEPRSVGIAEVAKKLAALPSRPDGVLLDDEYEVLKECCIEMGLPVPEKPHNHARALFAMHERGVAEHHKATCAACQKWLNENPPGT